MNAHSINHEKFRENITNPGHWLRLLYMLLFGVVLHVAGLVMWVLCALQFLFALLTGRDNDNLRSLGGSIAVFVHQALDFVCYNTEQKPFPFAAWPDNPQDATTAGEVIVEGEVETEVEPGQAGDSADTDGNPGNNR